MLGSPSDRDQTSCSATHLCLWTMIQSMAVCDFQGGNYIYVCVCACVYVCVYMCVHMCVCTFLEEGAGGVRKALVLSLCRVGQNSGRDLGVDYRI